MKLLFPFSRSEAIKNDKSFLDYPSKDQKKMLVKAVDGANKRQNELVEEYNRLQRLKDVSL